MFYFSVSTLFIESVVPLRNNTPPGADMAVFGSLTYTGLSLDRSLLWDIMDNLIPGYFLSLCDMAALTQGNVMHYMWCIKIYE